MFIRALSSIIVGSGIAIPTSTTIINKVYLSNSDQFIPKVLKEVDSTLEIHWVGKGIHKEIGEVIESAGKILNKSIKDQINPVIKGIELHTKSGQFNKDVCKKLAFENERGGKNGGIGCYLKTE